MKVLVSGSRVFNNNIFIYKTIEDIISKEQYEKEISSWEIEIVSGNNPKGVDHICEQWAKENNIPLKLFPADWTNQNPKKPENWGSGKVCVWKSDFYNGYNSLAGYLRNQTMANYCEGHICIAFDAEEKKGSTGTRDMIKRAKKAWMKVYHIKCHNLENVNIKIYNEGLQKE